MIHDVHLIATRPTHVGEDIVHTFRVFVEDGERAVCVILYKDGVDISACRFACRFDQPKSRSAVASLLDWLLPFELDDSILDELTLEFREEFRRLQRIRRIGYDPSLDYLGRSESRRFPADLANLVN